MAPKAKAQKMSLGDFLGDQALGSWADEMEDMPAPYFRGGGAPERRAVSSAGGFGDRSYDREDRYPSREPLPLPTKPPYTAHLGNLPFDATQGDIEDFFAECEVTSVRIVEDKIERRPKGFGYVEFASLDGLKNALELNMTQFKGRNIKISVADPPKDRGDRGDRQDLDWTRKGPLPDLPNQRRNVTERGSVGMERGGSRRGGPPEGDGKDRDFSNWERRGPLSPLPNEPGSGRGNGRVRERKSSPSWGDNKSGEGRSQDGSRPPREAREKPQVERTPTAAELDNEWRARMRPDNSKQTKQSTPDTSTPSSPKPATARPRLNLQKRTVSEAEPNSATTPSDSKASPFGAARPIDTATREKEVEAKREMAYRSKKEAEEKAAAEKKANEAEDKSEDADDDSKEKSNGDEPNGSNISVLSRENDDDEADANDDEEVGAEAASKDEKPNGVSRTNTSEGTRGNRKPSNPRQGRDPPRGPKSYGSWRGQRKPSRDSPAQSSGNAEDDGWSTVGPSNKRGSQRGRGGRGGS